MKIGEHKLNAVTSNVLVKEYVHLFVNLRKENYHVLAITYCFITVEHFRT